MGTLVRFGNTVTRCGPNVILHGYTSTTSATASLKFCLNFHSSLVSLPNCQVKALALRMAEQRAQAENPTQDTKRPAPSGDEPLDLSEPEDWGEASPFESRQAPRTKADLLNEIRQRTDRLTGQREAEQRQIDPWSAQPPQRRGHGR